MKVLGSIIFCLHFLQVPAQTLFPVQTGWIEKTDDKGRVSARYYYSLDTGGHRDSLVASCITKTEQFVYDNNGNINHVNCTDENGSYIRYGNLVSVNKHEADISGKSGSESIAVFLFNNHSSDTITLLDDKKDKYILCPGNTAVNVPVLCRGSGSVSILFTDSENRFQIPVIIKTESFHIDAEMVRTGEKIVVADEELLIRRGDFALLELRPEKSERIIRIPLHSTVQPVDIKNEKPGEYAAVIISYSQKKSVNFILEIKK